MNKEKKISVCHVSVDEIIQEENCLPYVRVRVHLDHRMTGNILKSQKFIDNVKKAAVKKAVEYFMGVCD